MLRDPVTLVLLDAVLYWPQEEGQTSGAAASERQLAQAINVDRSSVSRRLRLLAHYGAVKVYSQPVLVVVNPELSRRLTGKLPFKRDEMKRFWTEAKKIGEERDAFEADYQGFSSTEYYGGHMYPVDLPVTAPKPHAEGPRPDLPIETPRVDPWRQIKATADADRKDREKRERLEWVKLGQLFIDGAAKVWNVAQVQKGRPDQMPVWHGDLKLLPPAARRMRQELVKIFEHEGGQRACLAWYIFCGTTGGTKFDPRYGHRNWATLDKQPSFFAKHFNAITSEQEFSEYANDSDVQKHLTIAFGDLVPHVAPRPVKGS